MRGARCADCVFWAPPAQRVYRADEAPVVFGQCRRYPPVPTLTPAGMRSFYSMTAEHWWCGEHAVEADDEER